MKFNRLTTIKYLGCKNGKTPTWKCKCECGTVVDVFSHHLKNDTKSCGCLKAELLQGTTIQCKTCQEVLAVVNFHKKGPNIKTRHNKCKPCLSKEHSYKRKKRNMDVKHLVFCHYSGTPPKCECCGELSMEFLTIDHINGGGSKHRKELGKSSGRIYRWLRDNHYPSGYRVLCMNCNHSNGLWGYCPHQSDCVRNEFMLALP